MKMRARSSSGLLVGYRMGLEAASTTTTTINTFIDRIRAAKNQRVFNRIENPFFLERLLQCTYLPTARWLDLKESPTTPGGVEALMPMHLFMIPSFHPSTVNVLLILCTCTVLYIYIHTTHTLLLFCHHEMRLGWYDVLSSENTNITFTYVGRIQRFYLFMGRAGDGGFSLDTS